MSFFKIAQLFFFSKRKKEKREKENPPLLQLMVDKGPFLFFPLNFVMLLKW